MITTLKRLWKDDEAANAVEYGLITAVIAITLIAVLWVFRNALFNQFNNSANQVNGAGNPQ
jgi:Flp pilus assembly pilin Flp